MKNKLRYLQLFLLIILQAGYGSFSYGQGQCDSEFQALARKVDPLGIVKSNDKFIKEFNFIDCNNVPASVVTCIHEGAHFIDLDIHSYAKTPQTPDDLDLSRTNFILPDGSRFRPSLVDLPSPLSAVKAYLERQDLNNITDSLVWGNFYKQYISDKDMQSGRSFLIGVGTEWNAYTHGAKAAYKMYSSDGIGQQSLHIQRAGIAFFVSIVEMYLAELRQNQPGEYNKMQTNNSIKSQIAIMFQNAMDTFGETNFCGSMSEEEREQYSHIKLLIPFSEIQKLLGDEFNSQSMLNIDCSSTQEQSPDSVSSLRNSPASN